MSDAPKFDISREEILELLTGERFYGDSGAAVREGILNALDACHRHQENNKQDYQPEISVTFDNSNDELIIEDNGDGMGAKEIDKLFSQIGKSARHLDTKGSKNQIGEFGIGVVSYFLIADSFDVYSKKEGSEPVSYRFSKSMFAGEAASGAPNPGRSKRGTTVVLHINYEKVSMKKLKSSYTHWVRYSKIVSAVEEPSGKKIKQNGLPSFKKETKINDLPPWIEEVNLGLSPNIGADDDMPGAAKIDVLYRGVYLDSKSIGGPWGIRGAIHVSPNEIQPKLNREDYLESGRESKLKQFLNEIHPKILEDSSDLVAGKYNTSERPTQQREIITRWMAVPNKDKYEKISEKWDTSLQDLPVIEEITPEGRKPISVTDLKSLDKEKIYYIKSFKGGSDTLATEAANILRKKNTFVFTGVSSKRKALKRASSNYNDSAQFVINRFKNEIPEVINVKNNKRSIIQEDNSMINVFSGRPEIKTVSFEGSSEPFVVLSEEVWLNVDCDAGKSILNYLLENEQRERGLVIACHLHSPEDIKKISSRLESVGSDTEREIGIVRRNRIREVLL